MYTNFSYLVLNRRNCLNIKTVFRVRGPLSSVILVMELYAKLFYLKQKLHKELLDIK